MAAIFGIPVGAVVGFFLGFCIAAAKLMGDAEVYPSNQLPAAPDLLTYLCIGIVAGAVLTPLLFALFWHAIRLVRYR